MNLWVECERIAERDAECELEPWQVLEQMMAEYLSTYGASMKELFSARQETEDEKDIPLGVRQQVIERDDARCRFPGCSMRAHLGLHHIQFRSRGGDHAPENLITLCAAHHTLIHRHICAVDGRAPDELRWKGPFLDKWSSGVKNKTDDDVSASTENVEELKRVETTDVNPPETKDEDADFEILNTTVPKADEDHLEKEADGEDWRKKEVAAIFDGPSPPREKEDLSLPFRDIIGEWCEQHTREFRKKRRFGKTYRRPLNWLTGDEDHEHVFTVEENGSTNAEQLEGSTKVAI
jgi:hypothetical protein